MATYSSVRIRCLEPNGTTTGPTFYAFQKLELLDGAGDPIDLSGATITATADGGSVIGSTANLADGSASTYLAFSLSDYASQRPWIEVALAAETEITGIALTAHDTISGADVYGTARLTVHGWLSTYDWADQIVFDAADRDAWALNERREIVWPESGTPAYRYYRVRVDTAQGSTSFGALSGVEFYYSAAGLGITSAYDRSLDSSGSVVSPDVQNLFDLDNGTAYHWGSVSGPQWVEVDFGGAVGISTVYLYQDVALANQAPLTGAILGSNDGSTWDELGAIDAPSGSWPSGWQEISLTAPAAEPENPGSITAPIACAAGRILAMNDFTGALDPRAPVRFVCDIVDAEGNLTRVPISSWQGTLQTGAASYAQAVIPNVAAYVSAITSGAEIVISRVARLLSGDNAEIMVARVPLQTYSLAQGPYRYTGTISGYADAFPAIDNNDARYTRTLTGLRATTATPDTMRVRADIDWLMYPGFVAAGDGFASFTVAYQNIYATGTDAYMEVGSRAAS